ncbi:MAG: methyltransferase [Chitinophagaceae bacterium]|nr:methyltransferase [Chitinophagaceae bacterium]
MDVLPEDLQRYLDFHTDGESSLLATIDRDTHLNVMLPRMLSGHFQGRCLSMLSKLIAPKTILEIGTYTGYSALCLAEGLARDGKLISIDVNEELEPRVMKHWKQSNLHTQMELKIGDATTIIPGLDVVSFDLVFIDADKKNYALYYDLVIDRVPSGGIILADNVLWSGKVYDETAQDKDTIAMRLFNDKITQDHRVEKIILPIRDGVFMIRKK